jgi:hypothetical protein
MSEQKATATNETAQHTPGPWKTTGSTNLCGTAIEDCAEPLTTQICSVNDDVDEWKENARLIAAAPEMARDLARLREVNAALFAALEDSAFRRKKDGVLCWCLPPTTYPDHEGICQRSRAAIALARQEAPR